MARNDPGLVLTGETAGIRSGATGLMTSIAAAAGIRICRDGRQRPHAGRIGNVRTVNRKPPGSLEHARWPALRSARWRSAAWRWRPTSPLKAPHLRPGVRLERLLHRRPHRLRPRFFDRDADRSSCTVSTTGSVFSGVIGGVQGGYNVSHLPQAWLLGVEADLTFPNYLTVLNHDRRHARPARVPRSSKSVGTMPAPCAAALAMPAGTWLALRHRRFRLCRRTLHQYAPTSVSTQKHINVRPGWPPAPAWNTPSRRTGACKLEYLFTPSSISARCPLPVRAQIQFNARFPADPHRPSTARSTGRDRTAAPPKSDLTDPESDRWEIHCQSHLIWVQAIRHLRAPYTGTNSLTPRTAVRRPPGATASI